jgi:hypothetical protein
MGKERNLYKVLVEKSKGKRQFGRPRRRWENGIRMDLEEIDLGVFGEFSWLRVRTSIERL